MQRIIELSVHDRSVGSKAGSGNSAERIAFEVIADDLPDMRAPPFQSFFAFSEEIVALIDGCNTGDRTALMVQDFVGDMWGDAKPSHPGYAGSPQIMKSPPGDAGKQVDFPLGYAEVLERNIHRM